MHLYIQNISLVSKQKNVLANGDAITKVSIEGLCRITFVFFPAKKLRAVWISILDTG